MISLFRNRSCRSALTVSMYSSRVAGLYDYYCLGNCQTNWMGPVEPTIEGSQAASWRHSAKAVERLSLKLSRL